MPAIFFLSDYGTADEFVGVVHAVLHRLAPLVPVIDLSHRIPPFDVAGGATMLMRCAPHLGAGVVLAVVDPGVGTARRAVAIRIVSGSGVRTTSPASPAPSTPLAQDLRPDRPTWLVGPDNGLLTPVAAAFGGFDMAIALSPAGQVRVRGGGPDEIGTTFDGRDVFAPAAAHLALGGDPTILGAVIDPASLVTNASGRPRPEDRVESTPTGWMAVTSVASIDGFGNVQLALRPGALEEIGLRPGDAARVTVYPGPGTGPPVGRGDSPGAAVRPVPVRRVAAFADLESGELGLVVDGNGHMALVLDRASAAHHLHLSEPGAEVRVHPLGMGVQKA